MPTNLHTRAKDQQPLFEGLAGRVRAQLAAARAERDRPLDASAHSVPPDRWTGAFADEWHIGAGAARHLQLARAALAVNRVGLATARAQLAGLVTPAQAGADGAAFGALLVAAGEIEVTERDAVERVAAATSLTDDLGALASRADALVSGGAARTAWSKTRQEAQERLRAPLAAAPLVTLVADAAAALADSSLTDADDRLDALLPTELRTRAQARIEEALDVLDVAVVHRMKGEEAVADRGVTATKIEGDVFSAQRALAVAEASLDSYVSRAAGRLDAAVEVLNSVAGLPDLTPAQVAALDAADRPDAVTAVEAEAALAEKVVTIARAQRDLDDAVLTALSGSPDADPDADADVSTARDALARLRDTDAPTLADARSSYVAGRGALDAWEVEVPPALWEALTSFVLARRDLAGLADQGERDVLVGDLDGATDALAAALDNRDISWRGDVEVACRLAVRTAAERAALEGASARLRAYAQGSGPSGRTPAEL